MGATITRTVWKGLVVPAALVFSCLTTSDALVAASYAPQASSSHPAASSKKKTTSKKHHSKRETTQKSPTPARISEIQGALARNGYYQGNPNGKWDSNSVAAMQKFQSANGLDATGKLNALSLQKLGLGSSIAGVSAPKPKQPPSNNVPAPTAASQSGAAYSNSSSASNSNAPASAPPPQI
jgi:peptidoglycan hydrolase-like protein with peptidoglycan-binding domain